ncbi:FxLD family lanthipeptide [Glycomyces tenuis]|uniref:FxLD family lanthipeptide n=1 Tax=Glycomyces tenuis TaxID=58116 RepID=UPI0004193C14|nr:FxLD family lanthipeptide [Glycomyces tenuis]
MASQTAAEVDKTDETAFDLDISIIEASPDLGSVLYDTSDNCGHTCESACSSCP